MNFISMCSGIEAASVAFGPLGWTPIAFSEIEPFPCAVLKHRYPEVPNHGDLTKFDWSVYRDKVDAVCAGFPCQAFSIAGLGKSLEDNRGNLSLIGVKAIRLIRSRWVLLEQVPGVLSKPDNPFGCILAGLAGADAPLLPGTKNGKWSSSGIVLPANKDGYGLAWRVLDAQYHGVPQLRRRIFVVGHLGNWRPAAQVLLEPQMRGGDIAAGGNKRQEIAPATGAGVTAYRWQNKINGLVPTNKTGALKGKGTTTDERSVGAYIMATGQGNAEILEGRDPALTCNHEAPIVFENRRREPFIKEVARLPTLSARAGTGGGNLPLVMAFKQRPGGTVRRLTPLEVERAQGFPDGHTAIPYKGKPADKCPDGPRYKALGNSWAVPCARWIGERIAAVDAKIKEAK